MVSEERLFRLVLIVAAGAAVVIAVALAISPLAGAITLIAELALAAWAALRRRS